jgi:hypothetical protein
MVSQSCTVIRLPVKDPLGVLKEYKKYYKEEG